MLSLLPQAVEAVASRDKGEATLVAVTWVAATAGATVTVAAATAMVVAATAMVVAATAMAGRQ